MKIIASFIFFTLISCTVSRNANRQKVICVEFAHSVPEFDTLGRVQRYDTGFGRLYSKDNDRIYDLYFTSDTFVNGLLSKSHLYRHFLVFNKDSLFGYDININRIPVKKKVLIDSVLKWEWIAINKIYPILTGNIAELISSESNKVAGTLTETYILKDRKDSSLVGHCEFVYLAHFPAIDISLSRELDSIKRMKLVSTYFKAAPRYMNDYKINMSSFKISTSMTQISSFDSIAINALIKEIYR